MFLLAVKGLKTADFRFAKDDVLDRIEDNKIVIKLNNRSITLKNIKATYFYLRLNRMREQYRGPNRLCLFLII